MRKLLRRPRMRKLHLALAVCGVALGAPGVASAQSVKVALRPAASARVDSRWQESFDAFDAADKLKSPKPGGVLFVGSSSIRLWNDLETDFSAMPIVVKRGFGGSRMSDCTQYLSRLVLPYKPSVVIVYAGDNDLAEGDTPAGVLASFVSFAEGVRRDLPNTRIAYLSIKPSPLREKLVSAARETNALIEQYTRRSPNMDYIDVFTPMLGADGRPRAELFGPDFLHLNGTGYALWKSVISEHLGPVAATARVAGP